MILFFSLLEEERKFSTGIQPWSDSGGQPLLASTNSYPSFLIDNFDTRQGDVDPDPLLVLSLRSASCCHSLERLRESGK